MVDRRIKLIKTSATARDVPFDSNDMAEMAKKLNDACHYCAFIPGQGEVLNGLDRLDASLGYTDANTVPCCAICNSMKGAFSADEFIYNVRKIVVQRPNTESEGRRRLLPFSGNTERREADEVDKTDHLPKTLRVELQ